MLAVKTKITLLVALFVAVSTTASLGCFSVKKVAIVEVVDRSGEVAESTKSYIRSELTRAITKSSGYVGYSCSADKFKYVLTSEVTPLSKNTVLLTVRVVETSTGKIIASSSVNMSANLCNIRKACKEVVRKL